MTQSYHPHIGFFDTPGFKDILVQMTERLDIGMDGRSIDIEQLDITSYLLPTASILGTNM